MTNCRQNQAMKKIVWLAFVVLSMNASLVLGASELGGFSGQAGIGSDGSEPTQITSDDYNNWFARPSPDGRWIDYVTFAKEVKGHPANQAVMRRRMSLADGNVRVLAKLVGSQGTVNVPSWSPDSKNVAFVSYQPVYP